jgi:tungstate transport system substrate-binding protein
VLSSLCRSLLLLALVACAPVAFAADRFIVVSSTTSTESSGLFGHILPIFTEQTGIEVRVVAGGTGQAIKNAYNGDADVLFVHHQPSEEKFVADGDGVRRYEVMYNDFVIVGPAADPAAVAGMQEAPAALAKIAEARAPFASRGDDSGTHKTELALWADTGTDPKAASGSWYREIGSGMGATLNTASAMDAYTLSDRGSWLPFENKGNLKILVEGDPKLFNQYGVILVNAKKHPHVKTEEGQAFVDWLISPQGQAAIAELTVNGEQAFFPNASGD